jgi:hypothetical protein
MSRKNGGIIGPANTPVGGLMAGVAGGVWRMNDLLDFVGNSQWPSAPQNIENSCRFDKGSSDHLTRTPSSAGNRKTWTWSGWVKRATSDASNNMVLWSSYEDANNRFSLQLSNTDQFQSYALEGGSLTARILSEALLRDRSAWYHFVYAFDTTQSTATDRQKLYINGVQVDIVSSSRVDPSQDAELAINDTQEHEIGAQNSANPLDGYLAEVVFIDGLALDPTSFGEFDSTTGIWKPKKIGQQFAAGGGAGTNGYYLDFKDSSNLGNDASGNNNDFSVTNLTSIDQTTDTCVENFATLNALNGNNYAGLTFSQGNLKVTTTAGQYAPAQSTIGFNKGKWYAEFKATDVDNWTIVGIVGQNATATNDYIGKQSDGYGYVGGSSAGSSYSKVNNSTFSSYGATYTDGDIISVAVDADNNKIYFAKNGTYIDSGDPTSGSTGTGAAFTISSTPASGFYFFAVGNYSGSQTPDWEANFGNSPFSISSGNSDANGFGNFEYSVPSGYYALNTSNLNTYG